MPEDYFLVPYGGYRNAAESTAVRRPNVMEQIDEASMAPSYYGGNITPSVVTAPLPAKFHGSQKAAQTYAQGYLRGAKPMTEKQNEFGYKYAAPALAIAATAPFAVEGLALASPYIGSGLQSASQFLAGVSDAAMANPYIGKVYNPLTRTLLDTWLSGQGIVDAISDNGIRKTVRLAKEGDAWGAMKSGAVDLMNILGANDFLNVASRFNKANMALHAYDTILPYSYDGAVQRGMEWLGDIIRNKPVDIASPKWMSGEGFRKELSDVIRQDAWAMYNNLPQPNGFYIKNPDGTYSIDMKKVIDYNPSVKNRLFSRVRNPGGGYTDNLFGTHGGWKDVLTVGPDGKRVRVVEDRWDLNPFRKLGSTAGESYYATKPLFNTITEPSLMYSAENLLHKMRSKHWKPGAKTAIGKVTSWLESPLERFAQRGPFGLDADGFPREPITDFLNDASVKLRRAEEKVLRGLKDFEVGSLYGGTPFYMKTTITE